MFYLTFLWLVSWPILFIITRKYEIVKVVYPYADKLVDDGNRICTVMSEIDWFQRWKGTVKRAAMARMVCKERALDEEYRMATDRAEARGLMPHEQPNTGNAFADSAISVLGQGLRITDGWNAARGWGGDC